MIWTQFSFFAPPPLRGTRLDIIKKPPTQLAFLLRAQNFQSGNYESLLPYTDTGCPKIHERDNFRQIQNDQKYDNMNFGPMQSSDLNHLGTLQTGRQVDTQEGRNILQYGQIVGFWLDDQMQDGRMVGWQDGRMVGWQDGRMVQSYFKKDNYS